MNTSSPPPLPARSVLGADIVAALARCGIDLDTSATAEALTGGVSSDIWKVATNTRVVCVKRALARLRTEIDWEAPVARSASEAHWLHDAANARPGFVPETIAFDEDAGVLVLEYLDATEWTVWKKHLLAGQVDVEVARRLGDALGAVHAAMTDVREHYRNGELFDALRLEPYVKFTAGQHPEVAGVLTDLVASFDREARTVVHGDVSPKNVLVGHDRVVLLDAECATWGDPAFDIGFCLTHLCAKGVHLPDQRAELAAAAHSFVGAYDRANPAAGDTGRPCRIGVWLPAVLLARIDGRSPLEYLDDASRAIISDTAVDLLGRPSRPVHDTVDEWFTAIGRAA